MMQNLNEIKQTRKNLGINQKELAERAGVSQSLIAKIESGKIDPTFTKAKQIFQALEELREKEEIKTNKIMNRKVVFVQANDKIKEIIQLMKKKGISQVPVLEKEKVCGQIGEQVALIHDSDIVHGDLTTSNMILRNGKVYFIDFGLGFVSNKEEHKAVDIHLLKQAFESRHYKYFEEFFSWFLKGYQKSENCDKVMKRLEKVEKRGRYKRKN